jgi:hypothetical protein
MLHRFIFYATVLNDTSKNKGSVEYNISSLYITAQPGTGDVFAILAHPNCKCNFGAIYLNLSQSFSNNKILIRFFISSTNMANNSHYML